MKIRYFTCRHAGSAHDAKIFGESFLHQILLNDFDLKNPIALMGDEAYAAEDVMLPPIRKTQLNNASPEMKAKMIEYNRIHKKTRILVEHTFGVIKKRFPVLLSPIRSKTLENVQAIVSSVIVIHNILIDIKDPFPTASIENDELRERFARFDLENELGDTESEKFRFRTSLIKNHF
jgi:hypothetical protein